MGKLLAVACLCLLAFGCRTNPVTGQGEMVFLNTEQELAMGDEYHPNIIFMYDGEYQDPALKAYLGTIVLRLHDVSHRRDMRTDFTLLNSSVVNAFAIPGHVYTTRSFLAQVQNEAQFAAAMGHELTHVAAGHTAKSMSRDLLVNLGLGVMGAAMKNAAAAQAAASAGQLSVTLLGLSYSREQEIQADRVGTYYLALAGWDPRQSVAVQKLISSLSQHKETVLDKYLSTHPLTSDRLAEIESVIQERQLLTRGYVQGDGIYVDRWNKGLANLKTVNKSYAPYERGNKHLRDGQYAQALEAAEEAIRSRSDQAPFYRLKGDALLGLGRPPEAKAAFDQALRLDRRYVPANIGLGQVALRQNEFVAAEQQFAAAARAFPLSPLAHYGLGLSRYHLQKYAEAIPSLEMAAEALGGEPMLFFALGVCYEKTGQPDKAYSSYQRALQAGLGGPERTSAIERTAVLSALLTPARQAGH